MTFEFVTPTVKRIAQIALDAAGDRFGPRVLEAHDIRLVVDEERRAYLLQVNATMRNNSLQLHYMLYFRDRFWHVRTRMFTSREVGFYAVPLIPQNWRTEIQSCFADAVKVYGWWGNISTPDENVTFVPVFTEDDYEPSDV